MPLRQVKFKDILVLSASTFLMMLKQEAKQVNIILLMVSYTLSPFL